MPDNTEIKHGFPVDSHGHAMVDPTQNVSDLVEAAVKRIDDLRHAEKERVDGLRSSFLHHLEDMRQSDLLRVNDLLHAAERRATDLTKAENRRIDEQAALHAAFQEKMATAEMKRLDSIRAVDIAAVATASERAAQQANVLQTQVATSAETLRALVASTAAQVATQLQQLTSQLTERISSLEKVQYETTGRSRVADPQLDTLMLEMRKMAAIQDSKGGKTEGFQASWAILVAAIGIIGTFIFIAEKVLSK